MSKNKTFTGPLAEHIRNFLNEKRTLGYKYEEQERVLSVLDRMSQQFDCSNGLPKDLCLAFIQWDPNWKQRTQEQRVTLIRTFAEYLIRHEIPAYLVDFSIVTKRNEDFNTSAFIQRTHFLSCNPACTVRMRPSYLRNSGTTNERCRYG